MMHDLRFAFRQLLKHPGLTLAVVFSLALGIGANTVVFSWIQTTLVNAIPGARDPKQLVALAARLNTGELNETMSIPDIESMREQTRVFQGVTGSQMGPMSVTIGRSTEWVWGQVTLANFFEVMGVPMALGSAFVRGDDTAGAEREVAVIGERYWQRRFAGDANVIGRQIRVDGRRLTIIGVAPESFPGSVGGLRFDLWVPLASQTTVADLQRRTESRGWRWLHTVGRLAPGVSLTQAQAAGDAVGRRLAAAHPQNRDMTMAVLPLWKCPWGGQSLFLPLLVALSAMALLLLALVASNVANLLLARAYGRTRELALRCTLGASLGRILRQLLTESLLLALLGGGLGVAMAVWGIHALLALMPPTHLPIGYEFRLSVPVLGVTLGLTVVTGLLFGLAPALQAGRVDLNETLKSQGRGMIGSGPRQWLRHGLVAGQIALATVLLLAMGLCLRSFERARHVDLALDPRRVWVAGFRLNEGEGAGADARSFYSRLRREVAGLPGVESVGLADWIPLGFEGGNGTNLEVEGYTRSEAENMTAMLGFVSPGYFETLRVPVLQGRALDESDVAGRPLVAVVNEEVVKRYLQGKEAVGRTIRVWPGEARIVGVVKTGKYESLSERARPFVWVSTEQTSQRHLTLAVRGEFEKQALAGAVDRIAAGIHPEVRPHASMWMEDYVAAAFVLPRAAAVMLSLLGVLALGVSAMGVYAVVSQWVVQRRGEMGVRLALGARPGDVLGLVLRRGLGLSVAGLALGFAGGVPAARALGNLLIDVGPGDLTTWMVMPAVLFGAAVLACWLPARRAARVDPMVALREE